MTDKQIAKIETIAKKMKLMYLYLFGPQARGNAKPLSDFDFAVKFSSRTKDTFKAKLKLMGELSSVLRRDDIDVVDMNKTNPYILFNIIKDAKTLYSVNESERKLDKARITSVFLDRRYYYDRHFKKAIDQMAG